MRVLSVEDVEHLREAPLLRAVVGSVLAVVGHAVVVRAGELDELEDLPVGAEPLQDAGVVGAGSTLGESAVFFHALIIARL